MQDIKRRLLETCKDQQQKAIDNLKKVVDDAQKSANEYGAPKDRYDSYRTQLLRKRDMFAQQLQKANEQLDILHMIDPEKKFVKVEFGALVITEKQKMLISVGMGKIVLNGNNYYAVSPLVPIFEAMEGKGVGDEFEFRGARSKIVEIY